MNKIPTAADWVVDPAGAEAASNVLIAVLNQDLDGTSATVAMGIAAQVLSVAAPIAGQALAGPLGAAGAALAVAGIHEMAASLASQHAASLAALTPDQQELVTALVSTAAAVATTKLPKGIPQ